MLTRIYGLAFASKESLDQYLMMKEEAEKRDHRKLGKELDLFVFSDLVGGGLPLWTPAGTLLRDLLDGFVWSLRAMRGYERVDIPHLAKKDLYETSGHWDKYKDDLFKITTREGHTFVLKPMNCPHHTQIYNRKQWSYRELPQRYATTTKVYRDEQSGELAGLTRVRAITQDDAHVFCREGQVKEEMAKIWDIINEFYGAFGFKLTPRLSLHDPKNASAYLGSAEMWQKTEQELRELVKDKGVEAAEALGEAAFYGPKIDFMSSDSLGRTWQVATIQLDMNMPERFDLTCINEKGEKERVVMIHAAIMGSIERFLAVLIEHLGGHFPTWLAPIQLAVLPVANVHEDYAKKVVEGLAQAGMRVKLYDAGETLGKRIREVKTSKLPYFLVIGDKEQESNTLSVEHRSGDKQELSLTDLILKLEAEVKNRE
jgi:threonyl-tRNA synthetase